MKKFRPDEAYQVSTTEQKSQNSTRIDNTCSSIHEQHTSLINLSTIS